MQYSMEYMDNWKGNTPVAKNPTRRAATNVPAALTPATISTDSETSSGTISELLEVTAFNYINGC